MTSAIIVSGASGAGKSRIARAISRSCGARLIGVGDEVFSAVVGHGLAPKSRAHAGKLFLEIFGEAALGPLLIKRIGFSELVIIDGLRIPASKRYVEDSVRALFHIHILASDEIRTRRLMSRDGAIDDSGLFAADIRALHRSADVVLMNE